jgi:hypothetical protein
MLYTKWQGSLVKGRAWNSPQFKNWSLLTTAMQEPVHTAEIKALHNTRRLGTGDFKASTAWVHRAMQLHSIVYKTESGQHKNVAY